ncbi:lysine--tRNA ligase [Candidatus Pacearchaeota archaeon CG10_big_fil_rev_8_21_14_0_10_34_76]|nr:MAG: lysine--tRNA ligase [Candidatus Pacearchaeota archaeon CG10_big_fil_rev_8_21_14_0_10_34_76]
MTEHWSTRIAREVIEAFPKQAEYTVAAGISPSGKVHIGNFRDVITSEAVYRALVNEGKPSRFIFSWDDFDRFRKVPTGFPESYTQYLGMPLSDVPDPKGEYKSYAERHEKEFEGSLSILGINPVFRCQSVEYRSGRYSEQIRLALQKRREIAQILTDFKTQGMSESEIAEYYPLNIYSRFTGKDKTKITSFDGERKVEYICLDTGKRDLIDIETDHVAKLPWRVDWPMRWFMEGVNFEPGGSDHASPGGSYDMGRIVSERIFNNLPPHFQGYGFIGIRGLKGKMSGSKGELVTPEQLLDIYEPALLRWLFLRTEPKTQFDFAFDSEVFRQYSEFDSHVKELIHAGDSEMLGLIDPLTKSSLSNAPIPFRQLAGYGQAVSFNPIKLEELLLQTGESFDPESIKSRLTRTKNWLERYNPEDIRSLKEDIDTRYLGFLNEEEIEQLRKLHAGIKNNRNMSLQEWETLLYDIPKIPEISEKEKKERQKRFFSNVYQLIFGTETGPRLSTYLWAEDKAKLEKLLPE